jgi:hypothetical protein
MNFATKSSKLTVKIVNEAQFVTRCYMHFKFLNEIKKN